MNFPLSGTKVSNNVALLAAKDECSWASDVRCAGPECGEVRSKANHRSAREIPTATLLHLHAPPVRSRRNKREIARMASAVWIRREYVRSQCIFVLMKHRSNAMVDARVHHGRCPVPVATPTSETNACTQPRQTRRPGRGWIETTPLRDLVLRKINHSHIPGYACCGDRHSLICSRIRARVLRLRGTGSH